MSTVPLNFNETVVVDFCYMYQEHTPRQTVKLWIISSLAYICAVEQVEIMHNLDLEVRSIVGESEPDKPNLTDFSYYRRFHNRLCALQCWNRSQAYPFPVIGCLCHSAQSESGHAQCPPKKFCNAAQIRSYGYFSSIWEIYGRR
jgi:hypothetical protein